MANLDQLLNATTLKVVALEDPLIDALGHDPRSDYAERFWLPVLGPSTTWLLRLFASSLERHPNGASIDVHDAARCLGIGERSGRHGPFFRTIARAVDFDMAQVRGPGVLATRRRLPSLSRRHLLRLPAALVDEHAAYEKDEAHGAGPDERGRRLALSLAELGEARSEIECQLVRWRFDEITARRCATWAERASSRRREMAGAAGGRGRRVAISKGDGNLFANAGLPRPSC